jgi:hypothetical protein
MFREMGKGAVEFFSQEKAIYIDGNWSLSCYYLVVYRVSRARYPDFVATE